MDWRDLRRLTAAHPAMLYFVYNPEIIGVIVVHDWEAGDQSQCLPSNA